MSDAAWGHLLLLTTTILGICLQLYREARNRRWQLEDRKREEKARDELADKVDSTLTEQTQFLTDSVQAQTETATRQMLQAVQAEGQRVISEVGVLCDRVPPMNIRRDDIATLLRQRKMHPSGRRHQDGNGPERRHGDGGNAE